MSQVDWKAWNSMRANAGTYAKLSMAKQVLRDVTRSFEDYNNPMEADAREAFAKVNTIITEYVAQCEARKAHSE
jgi:hypothetical protein